ncbi:MAG: hypothetical protein ABL895_12440 [Cyclobacteriaceae bacterium]
MKKPNIKISEETKKEVDALLAQFNAEDAERKAERLKAKGKKGKKKGKGWINIISVPFGGQSK